MQSKRILKADPNLWILGLVALCHGLVYMFLLAPWMGEDEPWHLQNVVMVAQGHGGTSSYEFGIQDVQYAPVSHLGIKRAFGGSELPEIAEVEDAILDSMRRNDYFRRVDFAGRDDTIESFDEILFSITAAHQPRLYYYLTAPLLLFIPDAAPETQMFVVRAFSLLLFIGTVLLSYGAARRAFKTGPGALMVGLFMALWPMSARGGVVINNDVLTRFLVALALFIAARWTTREERDDRTRWQLAWPPLALVLVSAAAIFTKTTGASAVVVAALAIALHPASLRRLGRTAFALAGLGAVVAAGTYAFLRSHNPGVTLNVQQNLHRLKEGLEPANLANLRSTLVGRFNWEVRHLDPDLSPAWGWALLALVVCSACAVFARRSWVARRLIIMCWGVGLAQLLLIISRGISKGRYLMPAAPALAILVVAGLFFLLPERWHARAALVFTVVLATFTGFFAWHGMARSGWLEWRW